jgi:hypothetical protein
MTTISDIKFNNQRVLTRVDFNVPLNDNQEVTDDTRIRATIPTIKKIIENGGKPVLMSHLGRPKGSYNEKMSLAHIVSKLEELSGCKVNFAIDCVGEEAVRLSNELGDNEILLLENLRFYSEEEKGDKGFAEKLSKNGDFYVNDAFGTAHRAHASTAVIADFYKEKKSFGLVMAAEIENVGKVVNNGKSPVTAIVGGAKVSSKIDILVSLLPKYSAKAVELYLESKEGLDSSSSAVIAKVADGNLAQAKKLSENSEAFKSYALLFSQWVRSCFKADIKQILDWAEEVGKFERERMKDFLRFCSNTFRDSLTLNFSQSAVNHKTFEDIQFELSKFAPYVHLKNTGEILSSINSAAYDISRNGNPKVILTDLGLNMARYLRLKP